jgi:hypothetical protein
MAAGSRDGAARPRHLDQDGAGRLCWRRSARETSGAVGRGRIVARAGGLPTGVPPGVSSPRSRRPVTWPGAGLGVRAGDGGRNGPGTPGV